MKKIIARALSLICASVLFLGCSTVANAQEIEDASLTTEPLSSIARNGSAPTKTWEVNKSGTYPFSGSSTGVPLYTSWQFKGKTSYRIKVNNTSGNAINIKAMKNWTTYASTRVAGYKSTTITLSGMSTGTVFYIRFASVNGKNFSVNGSVG